jgi:hypothetical protein
MTQAVETGAARIEGQAGPFWPAPRPYPDLSTFGWQWQKEGRYWIAFAPLANDYVMTAIFFDGADIPHAS